jgi:hypothetical protein
MTWFTTIPAGDQKWPGLHMLLCDAVHHWGENECQTKDGLFDKWRFGAETRKRLKSEHDYEEYVFMLQTFSLHSLLCCICDLKET